MEKAIEDIVNRHHTNDQARHKQGSRLWESKSIKTVPH